MKNILIVNYFGTGNKGDTAILIGMLETFQDIQYNISIVTHEPDVTSKYTNKYNVNLIESVIKRNNGNIIWPINILNWIFLSSTWLLFKKFGIDVSIFLDNNKRLLLKEYEKSDMVISCGGGYIHDNHGPIILLALHYIFIGIAANKPVVLYSQSVGPINNFIYKYITKLVLNKTKIIQVREEISKICLDKFGIYKPKIYLTADSAFAYPFVTEERIEEIMNIENIRKDCLTIGITIRYWNFPTMSNPEIRYEEYLTKIADIIKSFEDAQIVFIPMVETKIAKFDERMIAKRIVNKIDKKDNIRIIKNDYFPSELRALTGKMDILFGTRFHSVIFAISSGVPVISLMYEHKSLGIMKMLNLEEYVYNIDNFNVKDIVEKINKILKYHDKIAHEILEKGKKMSSFAKANRSIFNYD